MGLDDAEDIALPHRRSRGSTDVDLPLAAFDRDRAQVLHHGFRAVARATGGGQLHLVGAIEALELALDLEGERNAIAHAEAAEIGADAALAGAIALAVGVPGRHFEIVPDV